ncbi:hypothetical protein LCGC14_0919880 [marine sediment metagenome]|uniref:Gene product 88 domain-containing protein n=1 Tax=marine sediment metagenome TaxID=412755 RepID=A0A0F9RXS9_9ZZZZ
MPKFKLLSDRHRGSAKIRKSNASSSGYLSAIMYMAPTGLSGRQVCAFRSKGCEAACLNTLGKGAFANVQAGRLHKTRLWFEDRSQFWTDLIGDIHKHVAVAHSEDRQPAVRLNGTSDIPFEKIAVIVDGTRLADSIMALFPGVQFYDYTKYPPQLRANLPRNYHLTFSRSESIDWETVTDMLDAQRNVAIVFAVNARRGESLPTSYLGYRVLDGDKTDERFLDGDTGVIIGLSMKGKATKDTTGFVLGA